VAGSRPPGLEQTSKRPTHPCGRYRDLTEVRPRRASTLVGLRYLTEYPERAYHPVGSDESGVPFNGFPAF